jgi:Rod binding domain-containing protein
MLQPIAATPHNNVQPAPQPRLVRAAHEFEAQMMKELLKPLTAGDGLTGSETDTGSTGALGDYASEALGRALSEAGGFGIASRIVGQVSPSNVSHSGNQPAMVQVTANLHADTAVRTLK